MCKRGPNVIVYPEGTLTRDPDLWPMRGKTGAVRLALVGGLPATGKTTLGGALADRFGAVVPAGGSREFLAAQPVGVLAAIKRGSWFDQVSMTAALVGFSMPIFWWGLLLIIFVGLYAVTQGKADFSRAMVFESPSDKSTFIAISMATALAFFAMVGFEDSVNMAEETHEPSRIFPKVMLTGLGITGVIYVLVSITAVALSAAQASPQAKVLSKPVHLRDLVSEVEKMVAA